jgi:hypothetical protein
VALLAVLLVAGPARADDAKSFRAVIDSAALEPSSLGGHRLRVQLSVVSLYGAVAAFPDSKSIRLLVNGGRVDAPLSIGAYGSMDADTAIVFVVQASAEFTDVLPKIVEAIDQSVLAPAGERTQVAILGYGDSIGAGKLGSVKAARKKIGSLSSDGSVSEPLLLDTLERALGMLRKAKTEPEGRPLRKMIVVIGDGRDHSAERDRVIRLGTRAAKDNVRIHSFAHSPQNIRRPLLLLGELSKRSLGTFRWIEKANADSWTQSMHQLHDEIAKQLVLTFFLPADEDPSNKKLKIAMTGYAEITTNEHKIPAAGCAGQPCDPGAYCTDRCITPRAESGRGVFGWVLLILGIIVAALVLLGVIGWFITKRQHAALGQPAVPASPGVKTRAPPVASASAPPAAAPSAAPGTGPRFYLLSGPRAGEEIALKHGFLIGKSPGCDLLIDDGYTSGHHAQIGMDQFGNCHLYDRGSTNGTFVNGVRVTHYALEHGTTVKIGSTDLRYLAQ